MVQGNFSLRNAADDDSGGINYMMHSNFMTNPFLPSTPPFFTAFRLRLAPDGRKKHNVLNPWPSVTYGKLLSPKTVIVTRRFRKFDSPALGEKM